MEGALLAGDGPVRRLSIEDAAIYAGPGFLWLHLEGRDESDLSLLKTSGDIPDVAAGALIATETRPRCDAIDDGAIINLRGPGDCDPEDSDRLVSIRLWVTRDRVTSLSRRRMAATDAVIAKMEAGRITDSGDLVAAYARAISTQLDPEVAALGDRLDEAESDLDGSHLYRLRRAITAVRSDAIGYRRFVAPDRDALRTLAGLEFDWLGQDDRLHIVEAADRFARMAEELEAVRERAALLHEQITDLRAEQVDQRALYISIVAFIFLPLTFITGLLGMNVEGIPYAEAHWAFWGIAAFCVVTGLGVFAWFYWRQLDQSVGAISSPRFRGEGDRSESGGGAAAPRRCPPRPLHHASHGPPPLQKQGRISGGSGLQLDVPIEIVAPALVEVVGREGAAVLLELPAGRAEGVALDVHMGLARGSAAFAQIARRAGGGDILPGRPPALGAGHDMIEGEFPRIAAILAFEAVAQEQVEAGEGGIFARPHILAKRDHAGQLHRPAGGMHFALIGGDDVDPLQKERLDGGLPRPQAQRIVAQRGVIRVEHQSGAAFGMTQKVRMIQGRQAPVSRRVLRETPIPTPVRTQNAGDRAFPPSSPGPSRHRR